ncbi:hypothetical protein [Actinoplanes sp. NPDC051494]|uniref:hypothetical protein n=1 Tax=Actinoplanes sp. NPDC051494 TaxID=3363907 RepID=UPI0037931098
MEDQLGALGLVLNCITLRHHIRVHGHYTFTLPDLGGRTYRPLRDPDAADEQ